MKYYNETAWDNTNRYTGFLYLSEDLDGDEKIRPISLADMLQRAESEIGE